MRDTSVSIHRTNRSGGQTRRSSAGKKSETPEKRAADTEQNFEAAAPRRSSRMTQTTTGSYLSRNAPATGALASRTTIYFRGMFWFGVL